MENFGLRYNLMGTDIIRRREKDLPPFQAEVGRNRTLKVEGTELTDRTQVGGKNSSLGSSEKKSKRAELINEIQIRIKLILLIALPAPNLI